MIFLFCKKIIPFQREGKKLEFQFVLNILLCYPFFILLAHYFIRNEKSHPEFSNNEAKLQCELQLILSNQCNIILYLFTFIEECLSYLPLLRFVYLILN